MTNSIPNLGSADSQTENKNTLQENSSHHIYNSKGNYLDSHYYHNILLAFMKGFCSEEFNKAINEKKLNPDKTDDLLDFAHTQKLSVHRFKQSALLPRVKKVLGILKSLYPDKLLDIGSGRGAFIWPLLNQMPELKATSIDLNPRHIKVLKAVSAGGYSNLQAEEMDVTALQFPDNSFHTITMLEVLEHIPDYRQAAAELVRAARAFIVLSVPSKPDSNPEHINLFSKNDIIKLFTPLQVKNIRFDTVLNHMIAVISL